MKGGRDTNRSEKYDKLVIQYYAMILRYCQARLSFDRFAAEECTQDVFLVLYKKMNRIDLDKNIVGWLYAVADRVVRNYLKKNKERIEAETEDMDSLINTPTASPEEKTDVFDCLSEAEYSLLYQYYTSSTEERALLCRKMGITKDVLYQRICAIRKKVKKIK